MRVLLTGAAGFIGSKVAEVLLHEEHDVTGLDNISPAYDVRLKRWRLSRLEGNPRFRFLHGDISDFGALKSVFDTPSHPPFDAVINLAARAGVRQSLEDPHGYYQTNLTGVLNILELCRAHGVPKLVQASTSSVYGLNERPFREDQPTDRPLSPYAASKKAAEGTCFVYHKLFGVDVTVLRYFTVYGPAGRPDMSIFRFVQWISEGRPVVVFGDGTQERDFTYVGDIARGTVAALVRMRFEVINLGSDRPVVLNTAIRKIEELVGREAAVEYRPAHPSDVPATWADISKAGRLLGWQPQTQFDDGIAEVVRWYQANRSWAKDIST